jgi:hypothetical protein
MATNRSLFSREGLRRSFRADPIAALLVLLGYAIGLAIAIGGVWVAWHCAGDYVAYDAQPIHTDLEGAVRLSEKRDQWVSIERAPWQCEQLLVFSGSSYLPARTVNGVLVVANFPREVDCKRVATKPLTGLLEPMSHDRIAWLHGAGLAGNDQVARELSFVSFNPKENALLGMIAGVLVVPAGLFFVPILVGIEAAYRRYVNWGREATRRALSTSPANRTSAIRSRWYLGALCVGLGIADMVLGKGWLLWGLPLQWIGVAAVLGGLLWVSMALTG